MRCLKNVSSPTILVGPPKFCTGELYSDPSIIVSAILSDPSNNELFRRFYENDRL